MIAPDHLAKTQRQPGGKPYDLSETEFWCQDCGARVTWGSSGKEYGHTHDCEHSTYTNSRGSVGREQTDLADPDVVTDGGEIECGPIDALGINDLDVGDELELTYDSPRSQYMQNRTGEIAEIGYVTEDNGAPTGTTEIVLSRRDEDEGHLIIWPAWDHVRTDDAGSLGEVVDAERVGTENDPEKIADGCGPIGPDGGAAHPTPTRFGGGEF
jgi:hypothetical protein